MKKLLFGLVMFFCMTISIQSQVLFNGGQTLQSGKFSLGINPVYTDYGYSHDDFGIFFHGGFGLGNSSDLGLKLGFGLGDTYIGMDYEKTIAGGKPIFSLAGGAHYWHDFAFDFGGTVTFPINNVNISTGLDMDLVFGEDANSDLDLYAPIWLPVNVEVYVQKQFSIVIEANIKLTNTAFTTVGGGINIYF